MNAQIPSTRAEAPNEASSALDAALELRTAGEALCRAASILAKLRRQPSRRPLVRAQADIPVRTEDRLSGKQLGAIRAASRRAGLSRDRLATLLEEITGTDEPSALSRRDASLVLDKLSAMTGYTR